MALTSEIAQEAGVHRYLVSIGVEPLEGAPRKPFWIVTIGQSGEGSADLSEAIDNAIAASRKTRGVSRG